MKEFFAVIVVVVVQPFDSCWRQSCHESHVKVHCDSGLDSNEIHFILLVWHYKKSAVSR